MNATSVFGIALGINLAVYVTWPGRPIPVYSLLFNVVGWLVFTTFSGDPWLPRSGPAWSRSAWDGTASSS